MTGKRSLASTGWSRIGRRRRAEPRQFLDLATFDGASLRGMLDLGRGFKYGAASDPRPLAGKTLAMVFEKPSTRTRVSFDVGMRQLGGETIVLSPDRKSVV